MPGEQTAGVPNHRYWQRQEKLRRAVEQAQRRANETTRQQSRAALTVCDSARFRLRE